MMELLKAAFTQDQEEVKESWCPCRTLYLAVALVLVGLNAEHSCIYLRIFNPFEQEVL